MPPNLSTASSPYQLANFLQIPTSTVVFYGQEGCQHCLEAKAPFARFAGQFPAIRFVCADVRKIPPPPGVQGVPYFLFYRQGKVVGKITGFEINDFNRLLAELNGKAKN